MDGKQKIDAERALVLSENESRSGLEASFEMQLEAWKVNSLCADQPSEIKELLEN